MGIIYHNITIYHLPYLSAPTISNHHHASHVVQHGHHPAPRTAGESALQLRLEEFHDGVAEHVNAFIRSSERLLACLLDYMIHHIIYHLSYIIS